MGQPLPTIQSVTPAAAVDGELLTRVYRLAARSGIRSHDDAAAALGQPAAEVAAAVERLLGDRLVRRVPDGGGFVAVDPEVAVAALVSPMEREISRRREQIAQARERADRFRRDYAESRAARATGAVVEEAVGDAEVRGLVTALVRRGEREVLAVEDGCRDGTDLPSLPELLEALLPLARRGVPVRLLCLHRNRAELAVRSRLTRLVEAGAHVRTASRLPRGAVVVDRSEAVLLGEQGGAGTAAGVRAAPHLVAFLAELFDHLWDGGVPLDTGAGYAEVADDLQRSILELMAQGVTDEVVARKLGLSVRSCRRHIAALFLELGAVSRFQAGVAAGRRRLVGVP